LDSRKSRHPKLLDEQLVNIILEVVDVWEWDIYRACMERIDFKGTILDIIGYNGISTEYEWG